MSTIMFPDLEDRLHAHVRGLDSFAFSRALAALSSLELSPDDAKLRGMIGASRNLVLVYAERDVPDALYQAIVLMTNTRPKDLDAYFSGYPLDYGQRVPPTPLPLLGARLHDFGHLIPGNVLVSEERYVNRFIGGHFPGSDLRARAITPDEKDQMVEYFQALRA